MRDQLRRLGRARQGCCRWRLRYRDCDYALRMRRSGAEPAIDYWKSVSSRHCQNIAPFMKASNAPMQKRALIVDTESETCELIENALTSVGIDSLTLNRSSEAPDILREGKFAVAFFGLRMTSPDGPELTRQMRDSTFNRMTPVVLISDDQRPTAVSQGFEAGASFFLYKPLDKERLLRLIRATQAATEHERRRTRRVPVKSRVLLTYGTQQIDGESVNVSMEGLLVKVPRAIPIGSSVNISMHLSRGMKPIVGVGCVVRLNGPTQMGIRLGHLDLAESQRLQEFLLPLVLAGR
jgi:DNA-binding response OmpR family regulator